MKNRIKICFLIPGHWTDVMGGAQYQVKCLIEKLTNKSKYEIVFVTKNIDFEFQSSEYEIKKIYSNPLFKRILFLDILSVLKILKKVKPDIIYQRVGCSYTGISAFYSKYNSCKAVWHVSSDIDTMPYKLNINKNMVVNYFEKKLLEYGIRHSNYIITQTEHQSRLLENNYNRNTTLVVKNFHPLPIRKENKNKIVQVLWIGNLKTIKQPEIFIRLARSLSKLNSAKFLMIGLLQGSKRWNNKISTEIKKSQNLYYYGPQAQEKVNELLSQSHILVNTSKYEGFPNTFIQAWMRRVPVVSLTVNPDGIFNQNQVGMLAGTFAQLLQDVTLLIENDQLRNQIGANAKAYAMHQHSLKNIDALENLFDAS